MNTVLNNKNELPHLGTLVKNKIHENKMTYAEVARLMGVKPSSINNYFYQKSLQTRIVWKLCQVLEYNFFADIVGLLPESIQKLNTPTNQNEIIAQQQEIADLKKEIAIYKEILSLKLGAK